ncbi:GNAT family N-acetyltransferase [Ruania alba]|uniref:Protein N-acetyltransferase, RimJ/RimL family n=1 Tax=Ruania alba TaxID=648782 RepID=A0A1H5L718_9MICO|nr:GNAT family protein [Ruania alba]SEE72813.1 Protein N-acetyltransferase, RimJ/RimL family [Ruania alba]
MSGKPAPCVRLRPLIDADVAVLSSWALDTRFRELAEWSPDWSVAEYRAFWRDLIADPPQDLLRLGVEHEGELCGYVDLHGHGDTRELGFLVGPQDRWGRGLGAAAAAAGLAHGFDVLGLHRVWAEAYDTNAASVRILARIGMVETGSGASGAFDGQPATYRQFALRREHWHPLAASA